MFHCKARMTSARRWKLGAAAGSIACAVALAQPSFAPAATTLGQTGPSSVPCAGPASYVQTATGPPPAYAVPPGGGVITAWSTEAGIPGAQVRLAVLRAAGAPSSGQRWLAPDPRGDHQYETVATSAVETMNGGALNTFATSLPAQAGDVLGLQIISGAHNCVLINAGSYEDRGMRELGTVFDVGMVGTYTEPAADVGHSLGPSEMGRRLNLSARLETDADGDGIGDEPPQTKVTKGAPKTTDKGKVKFTFSSDDPGATFECRLDRNPYEPCAPPETVKRLNKGKHKFAVRAVDADGYSDPSPAKDKFKVMD